MQPLQQRAEQLQSDIASVWQALSLDDKTLQLQKLDDQLADPKVWDDPDAAQTIAKQQSKIAASVTPWKNLRAKTAEISELLQLEDVSLQQELTKQLEEAETKVELLTRRGSSVVPEPFKTPK